MKKKILKAEREKRLVTHKRYSLRSTADSSSETMEPKAVANIFKALKDPSTFKNEGKVKTIPR